MTEGINPSNRSRKGGSAALAETKETPLPRVAGTPVTVDGEVVMVGKLSINQLVSMARAVVIAATHMTPAERQRLLSEAATTQDIVAILLVLDAPTVAQLFGIILDWPDEAAGKRVGALEGLLVVDALLEHNPWQELRSALLALARHFQSSPGSSA